MPPKKKENSLILGKEDGNNFLNITIPFYQNKESAQLNSEN
jgi:hypothetical protein